MSSEGVLGVNTEMMFFWTVTSRRMVDSTDISEESAFLYLKEANESCEILDVCFIYYLMSHPR
jgi:hypothetical protein